MLTQYGPIWPWMASSGIIFSLTCKVEKQFQWKPERWKMHVIPQNWSLGCNIYESYCTCMYYIYILLTYNKATYKRNIWLQFGSRVFSLCSDFCFVDSLSSIRDSLTYGSGSLCGVYGRQVTTFFNQRERERALLSMAMIHY